VRFLKPTAWQWLLVLVTGAFGLAVHAAPDEPTWFWFAQCGGPELALEVRLDSSIVYESTFPICHAPRTGEAGKGQEKKVHFAFEPKRAIEWTGAGFYKDKPYQVKTAPREKITGEIRLAAATPDAMILGVSFKSGGTIANVLHFAYHDRASTSGIAPGLTVTTAPK
jgi:hypothetical protein